MILPRQADVYEVFTFLCVFGCNEERNSIWSRMAYSSRKKINLRRRKNVEEGILREGSKCTVYLEFTMVVPPRDLNY